jgi:thioredoxin-related protein
VYGPTKESEAFRTLLYLKIMKKILFTVIMLFDSCWIAQLQSISFEEIDSLQRIEKKTIVFIQTDWCQFCHAMKTPLSKRRNHRRTQQRFLFY